MRHGRALLANRHVEAEDVLALLVDDRVHRDGGLAGPAVADDELTLATSDRNHGIDGLEAGVEWLPHRAPVHDARRVALDRARLPRCNGALAVHGVPKRVDHTSEQGAAHRDLSEPARPPDRIALLDARLGAEQHGPHVMTFEVQHHSDGVSGKGQQLSRHRMAKPVDVCDAVADLRDTAALFKLRGELPVSKVALDDIRELGGVLHTPYSRFGLHVRRYAFCQSVRWPMITTAAPVTPIRNAATSPAPPSQFRP